MIFVNLIELRNGMWNFKKVSFNCALPVFMGPESVRRTNESKVKEYFERTTFSRLTSLLSMGSRWRPFYSDVLGLSISWVPASKALDEFWF